MWFTAFAQKIACLFLVTVLFLCSSIEAMKRPKYPHYVDTPKSDVTFLFSQDISEKRKKFIEVLQRTSTDNVVFKQRREMVIQLLKELSCEEISEKETRINSLLYHFTAAKNKSQKLLLLKLAAENDPKENTFFYWIGLHKLQTPDDAMSIYEDQFKAIISFLNTIKPHEKYAVLKINRTGNRLLKLAIEKKKTEFVNLLLANFTSEQKCAIIADNLEGFWQDFSINKLFQETPLLQSALIDEHMSKIIINGLHLQHLYALLATQYENVVSKDHVVQETVLHRAIRVSDGTTIKMLLEPFAIFTSLDNDCHDTFATQRQTKWLISLLTMKNEYNETVLERAKQDQPHLTAYLEHLLVQAHKLSHATTPLLQNLNTDSFSDTHFTFNAQ